MEYLSLVILDCANSGGTPWGKGTLHQTGCSSGHESSAMSHRYTHVGKDALSRAAATLPEI
jgi:hypothetical protein